MIETAKGAFVVVGMNSTAPKFFWKGAVLGEVLRMVANVDEDQRHVRLHVQNTTNFDTAYAEMASAGIGIKKVGG